MEIRPYRSQVRSTPTLEPVNNTVPNAGYAYQAFGDMISKTGQGASSQMYQWNYAIQKRQKQDRKIAYAAGVQEMDVLFAELGKTMSDNMAQSEQDPYNAFSADTKNALNQTYSYNVNQIWEKTVGKAPDAETQAMLDLYFRQKKLEAGAVVEAAIKTHTDKVAALVMGKANAGLVETAINGDEKDIDNSLKGIQNNLNILAERGVISQAQILTDLDSAKKQINFGRAKNQIDALDYKQGQEFINKIDIDEESRKKLQEYHKDKWGRQKNIWQQEVGEAYEYWLDEIIKGTATLEGIDADTRFELHPELGMTTDYRNILKGILKNQDKELAAVEKERRKRGYNVRIDEGDYTVRYDIINDPDLTATEQEHYLDDINSKKKAAGKERQDNEYEALFDGFYQQIKSGDITPELKTNITKSTLKPRDKEWLFDRIGEEKGENADILDINPLFIPIKNNYLASVNTKKELVGQMVKAELISPEDAVKINKVISDENLYVDPRIVAKEKELTKRKTELAAVITSNKSSKGEKQRAREQLNALNEVSKSALLVIADNISIDNPNTKEQNIERTLKTIDDAINGVDVLGNISGKYSGNDPVIDRDGDGNYEIKFEKSYADLKEKEADAYDLRMTKAGEGWMSQVTDVETKTLARINGDNPGDYTLMFSQDNNGFYYDSRTEERQYRFVRSGSNYTLEERHPVERDGKMYASEWSPVKAPEKTSALPGVQDWSPFGGVPLFGHKVIDGMTEEEYQNWLDKMRAE